MQQLSLIGDPPQPFVRVEVARTDTGKLLYRTVGPQSEAMAKAQQYREAFLWDIEVAEGVPLEIRITEIE